MFFKKGKETSLRRSKGRLAIIPRKRRCRYEEASARFRADIAKVRETDDLPVEEGKLPGNHNLLKTTSAGRTPAAREVKKKVLPCACCNFGPLGTKDMSSKKKEIHCAGDREKKKGGKSTGHSKHAQKKGERAENARIRRP